MGIWSRLTAGVCFRISMVPMLTRIMLLSVRYRCPNVLIGSVARNAELPTVPFDFRSTTDDCDGGADRDGMGITVSPSETSADGVASARRLAMSICPLSAACSLGVQPDE